MKAQFREDARAQARAATFEAARDAASRWAAEEVAAGYRVTTSLLFGATGGLCGIVVAVTTPDAAAHDCGKLWAWVAGPFEFEAPPMIDREPAPLDEQARAWAARRSVSR